MNRLASALALPLLPLLPGLTAAQLTYTAGPSIAPLGSTIKITVSNDTGIPQAAGICYYVDDGAEIPVYDPLCVDLPVMLQPGQSFSFDWDQTDTAGNPVDPGTYYIVPKGDPSQAPAVQISAAIDGALSVLGTTKLGLERDLYLTAPEFGGTSYLAAASFTAGSLPTCGGTIPLAHDALLALTLDPANPFLTGGVGILDAQGQTQAPTLDMPLLPTLAGISVELAFLVFDPAIDDGCGILATSEGLSITMI